MLKMHSKILAFVLAIACLLNFDFCLITSAYEDNDGYDPPSHVSAYEEYAWAPAGIDQNNLPTAEDFIRYILELPFDSNETTFCNLAIQLEISPFDYMFFWDYLCRLYGVFFSSTSPRTKFERFFCVVIERVKDFPDIPPFCWTHDIIKIYLSVIIQVCNLLQNPRRSRRAF